MQKKQLRRNYEAKLRKQEWPGGAMTREARLLSGVILITVPTIQYGGYFLLTLLMDNGSGYMDNPLRQNFSLKDTPTQGSL
jgi:hypothetical protein